MAVRKIELETVETNLRNVSSSTEKIRNLQEEMEALLREYEKERSRYRTGEIARDVFENLTRTHEEKVGAINRQIASLIDTSTSSLSRVTTLVADHMPMRREAKKRHHRAAKRAARRTGKEAKRRK